MYKIAAIDMGSNAIRLTVGEVDDAGNVSTGENLRVPIRLGQDVFAHGALTEGSIQKVEEAFQQFKRVIEAEGVYRMRAVATSAMRDAANAEMLIERVEAASGIRLEIIDSVEEARLIHKAVSRVMDLRGRRVLLVDIGGGSMEVTLAEGQKNIFTESFEMGAVRIMKMMEKEHARGEEFDRRVRLYAETAGKQIERRLGTEKIDLAVGTGGNIVELGRLGQKLFDMPNERVMTAEVLARLLELLRGLPAEEAARQFNLRPDRADVILPAAIVLQVVMNAAKVKGISIPNVGVKEGMLYDLAGELAEEPGPERRGMLLESARHMGLKYKYDQEHAELTASLARQLFEQSAPLHGMGEEALLLLEVGALLHDIGHFINTIDHDKHGFYLLKANRLAGLNEREQNIVACVVRYHRGKAADPSGEGLKALPAGDRQTAMKLAALLSLADGLDASHSGEIRRAELVMERGAWRLKIPQEKEMERWAVAKRKALFEAAFGTRLEME